MCVPSLHRTWINNKGLNILLVFVLRPTRRACQQRVGEQSALLTQEEGLALMLLRTHLENVRVVLSTIGTERTSIECP